MICVCVISTITIKQNSKNFKLKNINGEQARYVSNRYHNTSSVTDMMSDLNWAPLAPHKVQTHILLQSHTPLSCHTIFKPINSSRHQNQTQIQVHSSTYRHQKTATNSHTSPGLSHFGINCQQHLPLQTQLTVTRA